MNDGVREEDEIHVGASDDLVVLVQEVLESFFQCPERLYGLINLGEFHVRVLNLFPSRLRSIAHEVHEEPGLSERDNKFPK